MQAVFGGCGGGNMMMGGGGMMMGGGMQMQGGGGGGGCHATMKPGDWMCNACGNHVFAKHASCPKCGAPHPNPEQMQAKQAAQMKPGDWNC